MADTEVSSNVDPPGSKGARERGVRPTTFDSLTGLVDHASFMAEADRVLGRASEGSVALSALLFIDLDCFKDVNDRLGHQAGDQVLIAVCRRIESVLRIGDCLGRLGGDELAVFVPSVDSADDAKYLAERIVRVCDDDVSFDGETMRIGASVGVAFSDGDARSAEALVHGADRAMYRAKAEGGSRWKVYVSTPGEDSRDRALEARVALVHARRSIRHAQQCVVAQWRDVVDLEDEPFATSLVEISHSLRNVERVLDRHLGRAAAAPKPVGPPSVVVPVAELIGTTSATPDRTRVVRSASDDGQPIAPVARTPSPGDVTSEPGGVELHWQEDRVCVRMWGEHDRSDIRLLERALADADAAVDLEVVVDMTNVTFLEAATPLETFVAATPLETFVEVPVAARSDQADLPIEAEPLRKDSDSARR